MYYAIDNSTIIKLANRTAALAFVRKGVNATTELYAMPKGWRPPKHRETMASIIASQGKAVNVHFKE